MNEASTPKTEALLVDNLLAGRESLAPDPFAVLAERLGSDEAAARWIRSTASTLRAGTFQALLACFAGDTDKAIAWLQLTAPNMPRDVKNIERFHIWVKNQKTGKPRRTNVSLDPELYRALIEKIGSGDKAMSWIKDTSKTIDAGGGSLSRALQAEIVRFISAPPTTSPTPITSYT